MADSSARNGSGPRSNVRDAEDAVDRLTKRVEDFVIKTAARAREEAEDIWAEARALSRRRS